jgi:hypothetical protein
MLPLPQPISFPRDVRLFLSALCRVQLVGQGATNLDLSEMAQSCGDGATAIFSFSSAY